MKMKEQRFEKVVEHNVSQRNKDDFFLATIFAIPFIGQIIWIFSFFVFFVPNYFEGRKVYWRKIK